jgi:hypothetical protein
VNKTLNPASLFVATVLGAVLLFWGSIASAETIVYHSNYFAKDGFFYDACDGGQFCVSQESIKGDNWFSFIYASSSVDTIDTIRYFAVPHDPSSSTTPPTYARWEVYKTNDVNETGVLIGWTNWELLDGWSMYTDQWKTEESTFNTAIEIGGGYYYRFVIVPETVENTVRWYNHSGNWNSIYNTNKGIYGMRCYNESNLSGCDTDVPFINDGFWTVDAWTSGTTSPSVELAYSGGITTGEYITTASPCPTNSQNQTYNSCNVPASTEVEVSGFANIETDTGKKVSIYLRDKFNNVLDSVAFYYTGAGYETFEQTFYNLQASTTYNILTCLSAPEAFPDFATDPECTTIIFTNGDNPVSYEAYWCEMFPTDPTCLNATTTSPTLWTSLGCDDIGITDVKLGVQCALVWAFEPSQNSIAQFQRAKDAILYSVPLGYVTYMVNDVVRAFTSTSTSVFTREIELGKYFGKPNTATTTISLEGMTSYFDMINPVWDLIETILWLAFAVWFIYWGLTRQL